MKFGPRTWIEIGWYLSTIAVFVITRNLYGSWLVSIGSAAVWALFYFIQGARIIFRLWMPIDIWRMLVKRFPPTVKVTQENADSVGSGTLNGCPLGFALIARKTELSVRISMVSFLRHKTIAVPWDRIEVRRVGTNPKGDYIAVVSFPEFHYCEMVLPWRKKFARFHDRP